MLEYPNPNRPFDLFPDVSSTYAMGAVLEQDGKIVSTFSRKFNSNTQSRVKSYLQRSKRANTFPR